MSRLDLAVERLSVALALLDSRLGELAIQGAGLAQSNAEREALRARVAELEEESRVLSTLTTEVEGRLDGTIAEIRQILGRG
jgi:hypothetical protein